MSKLSMLFRLLQYAPTVLNVVQSMRHREEPEQDHTAIDKTVADLRREIHARVESMEEDQRNIHQRIRDLQSTLATMTILAWTGLGIGIVAFVLAMVAIVQR